jgi:hypothetical protein
MNGNQEVLFIICSVFLILIAILAILYNLNKINEKLAFKLLIAFAAPIVICVLFLIDPKGIKNEGKEIKSELNQISNYNVNENVEAKTFVDAQRCQNFRNDQKKIICYNSSLLEADRIERDFKAKVNEIVQNKIATIENPKLAYRY